MRPAARTLAWFGTVLGAGVVLRLAGTGQLSAPPLMSPSSLSAWVDDRSPAAAGIAVVRLLAEHTAWYVLAVSALHAVAAVLRPGRVGRFADALTLPALRPLVRAGAGVGLLAASTVAPAGADTGEGGTARMVPVFAPVGLPAEGTGTATMRPVAAPAPPPPTPSPPPATDVAAGPASWRVEPGDSLWSIAAEVLADAWGRPATDREIDPFWRAVVERNRPRLVDPTDPDLLHPGQVLEVPRVPAPPA